MIDPVGLTAGQTSALASGVPAHQASGTNPSGGASFVDALRENIKHVDSAQQGAAMAQDELMAGLRTDAEGVMIETQKADTAFRMLLAIRNKLVEAFQELQQLRV